MTAAGVELWHRGCWDRRDVPLPTIVEPIAIIAPTPSHRTPAVAVGVVVLALLAGWTRIDLVPRTELLANVALDSAEILELHGESVSNEIAPPLPALHTESDLEAWYPLPERDGVRLDVAYTSLGGWIHPVTNTTELMPERASRHFGAARLGIERPECGSGHCGVDLDGPRGRPLVAVADGKVVRIERKELGSDGRSGRYVRLQHDDGSLTAYMHMDDVAEDLQVGDTVRAGQYIGTLGATAVYSAPPHLHFSLEIPTHANTQGDGIQTTYVDPAPFLVRAKIVDAPDRRHAVKPAF